MFINQMMAETWEWNQEREEDICNPTTKDGPQEQHKSLDSHEGHENEKNEKDVRWAYHFDNGRAIQMQKGSQD